MLQHLAYDAQLAWKRDRVARALGAHPALADVKVGACVASPRPLGYRNRSKLVVAVEAEPARLVLGAFAPRSHDVVDLAGCRIAEPPLDETAAALRTLLDEAGVRAYDERTLTGDLRHVVLRANHAGRVLAVWIVARPLPDGAALARRFRAARPEVIGVVEHENRSRGNAIFSDADGANERLLDGAGEIEEQIEADGHPVRLLLAPGAFFQANREVAALAYAAIAGALAIQPTERVVDAYCGVGGIALTLARHAAEVIGIESHAGAVAGADGVSRAQRNRQRPLRRRRRRAGARSDRSRRRRGPEPAPQGLRPRAAIRRSPASPHAPSPISPAIPRRWPATWRCWRRTATTPAPSRRSTCSPTRRTSRHSPSWPYLECYRRKFCAAQTWPEDVVKNPQATR